MKWNTSQGKLNSMFLSPVAIIIAAWSIAAAPIILGVIHYEGIPWDIKGHAFILTCLGLFIYFYFTSLNHFDKKYSFEKDSEEKKGLIILNEIKQHKSLISVLAILGLLSGTLFSIEMIFIVGITPTDILETRFYYLTREVTWLSQVSAILAPGGLISLIAVILGWSEINYYDRLLWLAAPLSLSSLSIFSGGRQTILQLILVMLVSFAMRSKYYGSKSWLSRVLFVVIALSVIGYMFEAAYQRNALSEKISKKDMLLTLLQANLDPDVEDILEDLHPTMRDGIAEGLIYGTHSIPNFYLFFHDTSPGPYMGLWQFPFVARRLSALGLLDESVEDRMNIVYDKFSTSGRFAALWPTMLRDLVIDFGVIGTLLIICLLGIGCGWVYKICDITPSLSGILLLVGANLICFYSVLLSVISDTIILFYMIISLTLYIRDRYKRKVSISFEDSELFA